MFVYAFTFYSPVFTLLYFTHFWVTLCFVFCLFCCLISGSHHSGSPLARGARYCMSTDSSKVYTIPQTSSSGPEPELGPGPSSEACGQTRPQSECNLQMGMKTADGDDGDDAHSTEGPPNISECGWVCVNNRENPKGNENTSKSWYSWVP